MLSLEVLATFRIQSRFPQRHPRRLLARAGTCLPQLTADRGSPRSVVPGRHRRDVRAEPVDRVRRQCLRDREVTGGQRDRRVLVQLLLTATLRNRHIAAVTTLALWAVLISRGAVDLIALTVLCSRPYPRHSSLGTSSSAIARPHITRASTSSVPSLPRRVDRRRRPRDVRRAHRGCSPGSGDLGSAAHASELDESRDIFVLLLDGYPRADSIADLFGADNSAFMDDLSRARIRRRDRQRIQLPVHPATLTSMLYMRPLHEILQLAPVVRGETAPYPLMRR